MKLIVAIVGFSAATICSAHVTHRDAIPYGAPLSTDTNQFVYYQNDLREPDEFDYYENEAQQEPAYVAPPAPAPTPAQPTPQPQPAGLDQVTRKPEPTLITSVLIEPTITAIPEVLNTTTNGTQFIELDVKEKKSNAIIISSHVYAAIGSLAAVGAVFVLAL